jgi:HAD superfamily hydrolase (TIGR01459 family)
LRGLLKLKTDSVEPFVISGLAEVADRYHGFILDLWGVVHDGYKLFDPVIPCLKHLKDMDKKIVLLSNAPRVSGVVIDQLTEFGLPSDLYAGVVTSGDMTLDYLRRLAADTYYHIGIPEKDSSLLAGIGMNPMPSMYEADVIIASNFADDRPDLADYCDDFDRAIALGIPMVCANPDLLVLRGDKRTYCSGTLAREYERRGGTVAYFGKPHTATYVYLNSLYAMDNWLAIGDALETDIKGANHSDIDSLLVLSGIHKAELSLDHLQNSLLYQKHDSQPDYITENLVW